MPAPTYPSPFHHIPRQATSAIVCPDLVELRRGVHIGADPCLWDTLGLGAMESFDLREISLDGSSTVPIAAAGTLDALRALAGVRHCCCRALSCDAWEDCFCIYII